MEMKLKLRAFRIQYIHMYVIFIKVIITLQLERYQMRNKTCYAVMIPTQRII